MEARAIAAACPDVRILDVNRVHQLPNKWEIKFQTTCGPRVVIGSDVASVCKLIKREADEPRRHNLVRV